MRRKSNAGISWLSDMIAPKASNGKPLGFAIKRPKATLARGCGQEGALATDEVRCEACSGTGVPAVKKVTPPGKRIYPAPCKECGGKGWIKKSGASPT